MGTWHEQVPGTIRYLARSGTWHDLVPGTIWYLVPGIHIYIYIYPYIYPYIYIPYCIPDWINWIPILGDPFWEASERRLRASEKHLTDIWE